MAETPKDRNGKEVSVGSRVKVVEIDPEFLDTLPEDEKRDVASMLNEVFEVYDIDEYGQAWVEKWWHISEDESMSHSVALSSSEMEVC
ncbi:MAG: hypothetical protein Cons2KO_31940 [Congregibacter sp.]